MRVLVALLALLALSGCGTVLSHRARTAMLAMNVVDLQACAGIPTKAAKLDARELLLQYDYKADTAMVALSAFTYFSLQLGPKGECHALFRVLRDGTVAGVNYAGTTASLAGPYAACAPLIKECVDHPDATVLPAGYDAFATLLPAKP